MTDDGLDWLRDIRRIITTSFGHDQKKIGDYLREREKAMGDKSWHSGQECYVHERWKYVKNLAFPLSRRFKTDLKPTFRASLRHSTFQFRHSSAPLSPQTPSRPVSAPRPGPTRPGPSKAIS